MSGKAVGVVLSGCGYLDGAEIHESMMTLLALDRAGEEIRCFAPNIAQTGVVNHLTGTPAEGTRNVLEESARIARGQISDIKEAKADDLKALVFPGGFGAAKNLCDFAMKGEDAEVNPDVKRLVEEMQEQGKPMGFWCIAPALVAAVFKGTGVKPTVTIGTDEGTARAIEAMGSKHENHATTEIAVDRETKIVTTPCYMLATRVSEIEAGVTKAVSALLELAS